MLPEFFQCPRRVRDLRGGPAVPRCELRREAASGRCMRSSLLADTYDRPSIWLSGRAESASPSTGRSSRFSTVLIVIFSDNDSAPGTVVVHSGTRSVQILSSARLFLNHLADGDLAFRHPDNRVVPFPPLFVGFCRWMQQQRGHMRKHVGELRRSTSASCSDESVRSLPDGMRAACASSSWRAAGCGWAAAKKRTTALRMFLRFLIAEGRCASELHEAVPVLVHRRLSSLPRYLSADDVERVIASCDRASAVGQRDRAILLLLARLGLRAGDIVHLRLRDIDWKAASFQVSGKGRRETRLPLTRELGDALVTYLTEPAADGYGHRVRSEPRTVSPVPLALCRIGDRRSRLRPRRSDPPKSRRRTLTATFRRDGDASPRCLVTGCGGTPAPPIGHHDRNLRQGGRHGAAHDRAAVAGGAAVLAAAVDAHVAVRRAAGLRSEAQQLASFTAFSEARAVSYVRASLAIEWAGLARSVSQRARRLGHVIRLARYLRAEDLHHEVPPAVFGVEKRSRPVPYILSPEQICQLVLAASRSGAPDAAARHAQHALCAARVHRVARVRGHPPPTG